MTNIEVVSASAGSGKTTRIARELRERVQSGDARPECVLATTFTNKAADELKERARSELFRAGLHDEAMRLEGARIGTVNSVCGRLVADFAFELGLSPELRVIDEDQAAVALRRVITRVVTDAERERLSELASRFSDFDWQQNVERLLVHARTNLLDEAGLEASKRRSVKGLLGFLPASEGAPAARDQAMVAALERHLQEVDPKDSTKTTRDAVAKAQELLATLRGGPAKWMQWAKVKGAIAGKKSDGAFDALRAMAGEVDTHPRLRSDLESAVTLTFDVTSRVMKAWREEKALLGVLDFVDQETLALELLQNEALSKRLEGTLDLVLVDEFQDTSPLQLELFTRLARLAKRSVWVGDQKQSIFGFRGTDPALMDAAIDAVLGGQEPETLSTSFRSRAPLVALTSKLFGDAFEAHGLPATRGALTAAGPDDAALGPPLEWWPITGKNLEARFAATAKGIVQLLADETARVRDRVDGTLRRPTPRDVAVLCRTNAQCRALADQLALVGTAATVRRAGLLATPEARAAVLGLRLFIDERDRLAAAEFARLIRYPDDPNGWLDAVLEDPAALPFSSLGFHERLRDARALFPAAGPLAALDAAVDALELREKVAQWGASHHRYANLDALRAHAVDYVGRADADGSAATPAGLIAYFEFLEDQALDAQATLPGADAVVVSTWHRAKGLEWPITVLALAGRDRAPPRFGFAVKTTASAFSLSAPLEGRWLRFWPNPFHPAQTTELRTRMEAAPEAEAEGLEADKQELRLLYVGWTRARDRLVLAAGDGQWMLAPLEPPAPTASGPLAWKGHTLEVQVRECEAAAVAPAPAVADELPIALGPIERPLAFRAPSEAEGSAGEVRVTELAERLFVTGEVDMNEVGQAVHGFLAVDRPELTVDERKTLARESLAQWGQSGAVRPDLLVKASDALHRWAAGLAPTARWHRELPVSQVLEDESQLRGVADLVLEDDAGFWLVDHKSFPGDEAKGVEKARGFKGQLDAYARALEVALAKPCRGRFIHLAVLGRVVELVS
ncbi:MAG: UvrD-helicase domain-containing protein [Myxococcus sp.]|nr:UvrD-helicase domain-containing protein [Myxococcus sp.]